MNRGPHESFFPFLYIQETAVVGFGSRTTACLLPEKRGAPHPVSFPIKVMHKCSLLAKHKSHLNLELKEVWEVGQKGLELVLTELMHSSTTKSKNEFYYYYSTKILSK